MGKGNQITVRPWCPFCGLEVERPKEPVERKMDEFKEGKCQCGAFFVCDPTGHNIGAAMVECLVHACHENWELAWDLEPEEDYLTGIVEKYDDMTHQVVDTGNLDGRFIRGILYFVRLNQEVAELAARIGKKKKGDQAATGTDIPMEPARDPKRKRHKARKPEVKKLADAWEIDALVDLAFDDKKTLIFLQRLLYDPIDDKRWQYAWIFGQVCARYSTRKPGAVSDLLHRMYEACSDSAAAHWGLIEAIGSVIAARPGIFGGFARHLLMFRNVDSTRNQVLWALGAIAETRPDHVRATPFFSLYGMLGHEDPTTRGLAVRLFGLIAASEVRSKIEELCADEAALTYYSEGKPKETTVAQLAREAMSRLEEKNND